MKNLITLFLLLFGATAYTQTDLTITTWLEPIDYTDPYDDYEGHNWLKIRVTSNTTETISDASITISFPAPNLVDQAYAVGLGTQTDTTFTMSLDPFTGGTETMLCFLISDSLRYSDTIPISTTVNFSGDANTSNNTSVFTSSPEYWNRNVDYSVTATMTNNPTPQYQELHLIVSKNNDANPEGTFVKITYPDGFYLDSLSAGFEIEAFQNLQVQSTFLTFDAPATVGEFHRFLPFVVNNEALFSVTISLTCEIICPSDTILSNNLFEISRVIGDPGPNDYYLIYGFGQDFIAPQQSGKLALFFPYFPADLTSSVSVSLEIPDILTPDISGLVDPVLTGNTLVFQIPHQPLAGRITIPFSFPGWLPAETLFPFYLNIEAEADPNLSNNTDTVVAVLWNSYDPNGKTVNKQTYIDAFETDKFQYVIHFQNDGNYEALNVVLRDTLSPNLDLSTFRVQGAKHPFSVELDPVTREVVFTFANIHLTPHSENADGSQGYIVYEISELENLASDAEISNTAYIYFDFNPPIVTNTTLNINVVNLGLEDQIDNAVQIFPNPAVNTLNFSGATIANIQILDLSGKEVLNANSLINSQLSVAALSDGVYQVIVTTMKGTETHKLVIRK